MAVGTKGFGSSASLLNQSDLSIYPWRSHSILELHAGVWKEIKSEPEDFYTMMVAPWRSGAQFRQYLYHLSNIGIWNEKSEQIETHSYDIPGNIFIQSWCIALVVTCPLWKCEIVSLKNNNLNNTGIMNKNLLSSLNQCRVKCPFSSNSRIPRYNFEILCRNRATIFFVIQILF